MCKHSNRTYAKTIFKATMVHDRDPTKNCVNTLIERMPKTIFKASYGVEKTAQSLFNTPKTITKV